MSHDLYSESMQFVVISMMANNQETFVHDGVEVVKTGRTANKTITVPGRTTSRILTLVEIKPLDDSFDSKKWVDPAQLFIIQD